MAILAPKRGVLKRVEESDKLAVGQKAASVEHALILGLQTHFFSRFGVLLYLRLGSLRVGTLPSAGKVQRGVVTSLDNLAELGVFGSLAAPAWSGEAAHCVSEPVCALR